MDPSRQERAHRPRESVALKVCPCVRQSSLRVHTALPHLSWRQTRRTEGTDQTSAANIPWLPRQASLALMRAEQVGTISLSAPQGAAPVPAHSLGTRTARPA